MTEQGRFRYTMSEKQEAIARVNAHIGYALLNHRNTRFANVNKTVPVWWLHIPRKMVDNCLHIVLKKGDGGLIWLRCPPGTLESDTFRYRPDKDVISLEIDISHFGDRHSGQDFSRYVELELPAR